MSWYLKVLKNYMGFSGRARRKEYWMFILFNMIIAIALSVGLGVIDPEIGSIAYLIYVLAVFLPSTRRDDQKASRYQQEWMDVLSVLDSIHRRNLDTGIDVYGRNFRSK